MANDYEWDEDFSDEDNVEKASEEEVAKLPAHWMPYTHVLDEIIEKHGSVEAKKNRWRNQDKLRVKATEVCPDFVSILFSSVYRSSVPPAEQSRYHKDEYLNQFYSRWRHRGIHEVNADINDLKFDLSELRDATSRYLKEPKWRSEYIDWYLADTLVYSDLYRTIEAVQNRLQGIFTSILIRGGGAKQFFGYLLKVVFFLVKWAIWLAVLFFVNESFEGPGVLVIIVATAAWHVYRWRTRQKLYELLIAMRSAYDVFASQTFSWEVAWAELNSSREKGAVWPGELYRLVELRKAGQ